jgi:L-lactate dehydrogenase complex protein LldG
MSGEQNRAIVLSRIRAALGVTGADSARKEAVTNRLGRHPRGTIPARAREDRETLIQVFTAALSSQGADVVRAATPEDAVKAIAGAIAAHDLPASLRTGSDPILAALPWKAAPSLKVAVGRAEAEDKAALSRAVAAAAETGTLFLASGADNPTTLAFLPEEHIVLVRAADILGAYEEAFDRLRAIYGEGKLPRSVNLVSGPSRTADVEQTIVRGAHGPKRLLVVILNQHRS